MEVVAPIFQESAFVWLCAALAGGCLVVAVAVRARHFLRELSERFIRLPPSGKAVLVAAVVVATVFAQKPANVLTNQHESAQVETTHTEARSHGEGEEWGATNQHESARIEIRDNPCQSVDKDSSELRASVSPCETIVSSNDVVRGYRLETVRTNAAISYTRPANARLVGTWHLTDAYRGRAWVLLGEEGKGKREKGRSADGQLLPSSLFLFPLGPHVVTSLWAHTWGKVRPQLRNASNEIVVIGSPMFARHDQSFLWTAATTNGSVVLTWENFFLGNPYEGGKVPSGEVPGGEGVGLSSTHRSTFPPFHFSTVSAQLELRGNGDFIARSNDVERVYRRVNPDDWDDDGIPNGEDDAPLVPSDTPQFGPHQTLPEGANTNNYYWVDLVAPDANALVTFTGRGASNLPDPSFVANAGETNRVVLLLGKPYTVDCRLPLVCVGASHPDVEVGEDTDGHLTVCRPVRCEIVDDSPIAAFRASAAAAPQAASGGRRLRFSPEPDGLDVTWNGNYCCLEPPPPPFTVPLFNCDGNCGCGGCAVGTYTCRFEGFELSFPNWPCGCSHVSPPDEPHEPREDEEDHEPQGPHVSATFSESAIIFEDAYENAPGETVARRSTMSEAEFCVYGGTKGGTFSLELRDGGRLERVGGSFLPREGKLESGESFRIKVKYQARSASGSAGDIKAVATFTEEESGEEITSKATLTAVRIRISPHVEAPQNDSPGRHKFGVCELVDYSQCPNSPTMTWNVRQGTMVRQGLYRCPVDGTKNPLTVRYGDAEYVPSLNVVEPNGIEARNVDPILYSNKLNQAGWIGMRMDLYVLPLDVSFTEVLIEEVPCGADRGRATGYFADAQFSGLWSHTATNGAGNWCAIGFDNDVGEDRPRIDGALPKIGNRWADGRLFWETPFGWIERPQSVDDMEDPKGKPPHREFATGVHQIVEIDSAGTCKIEKFDHQATRSIDEKAYLDGRRVK